MKALRYLIFAYYVFYPRGGVSDLKYAYDDYEFAIMKAVDLYKEYEVVEVFDTEKSEVIKQWMTSDYD